MKKIIVVSLLLSVAALVYSFAGESKEAAWFDMKNCDMCVAISSSPHLMENMTWEHFNISGGMMTVTTVTGDFVEEFRTAETKMGETIEKMIAGKEVKLCNACSAYGSLIAKGARHEEFVTSHGSVSLVTSNDAELVTMIQDWGNKTNAEMMKLHDAEKNLTDHEDQGK